MCVLSQEPFSTVIEQSSLVAHEQLQAPQPTTHGLLQALQLAMHGPMQAEASFPMAIGPEAENLPAPRADLE
jgi:hypothetical protein